MRSVAMAGYTMFDLKGPAETITAAGAAAGAVWLWLKKGRAAFRDWRSRRRNAKKARESMHASWPTVLAFIDGEERRADRSRAAFEALNERLDKQDVMLSDITAMQLGQFELSDLPMFVCDNDGRNRQVSAAYARWLGVGRDDLLDYRYKRYFPSYELARYMPLFQQAADDHVEFEDVLMMEKPDGTRVYGEVRMVPHPRATGPATHWVGMVSPISKEEYEQAQRK